jgi:hypothetical protein
MSDEMDLSLLPLQESPPMIGKCTKPAVISQDTLPSRELFITMGLLYDERCFESSKIRKAERIMKRPEISLPRKGAVPAAAMVLIAVIVSAGLGAERGFELLSRSLMQGPARCAALFGDHVMLGTGGGAAIYRMDGSFQRESFMPLDGEPYDIAVKDGRAYIATLGGGLRIVDISDPSHPTESGRYETREAKHCIVSGDLLILGDTRSGIYILDIRSPDSPKLTDRIEPKAPIVSIAFDSNVLAVVLSKSIRLYTAGVPGLAPVLESEYELSAKIEKCFLAGRMLYLLTIKGGILRTDLDEPSGTVDLVSLPVTGAVDFCVDGGLGLALTKEGGIVPFDASGDGECRLEGPRAGIEFGKPLMVHDQSIERSFIEKLTGKSAGMVKGSSIFLSGDRMAAVGGLDGISVYTLSKGGIRFAGSDNPQGFAIDLLVRDGMLYLANGRDGVRIGSVGGNGSIEWIGHIQTGEARDVAFDGDVLVLAAGRDGLKLYDVGDPEHPVLLGEHQSPYFNHAVVARNGVAYIAGGVGGVEVVDISDASRPALIWRKDLSEVRGIHVDEDFLYVADGYDGFRIYSLDEKVPTLKAVLDTPGWNCDCFVIGDTAYLADGASGIMAADLSERNTPRRLGSVNLKTLTREIHALPGTVFAAAHVTGVAAIDVSDPERPVIADRYDTVDDARGVFADDRFVYLASGSGGLYIFRYSK